VLLLHGSVMHWLSPIIIIISISNDDDTTLLHYPLRKSKLTLFWVSQCLFLDISLGFLELFSNYLFECLWPPLTQSNLLPGHHENI
jgi:hypothetical protein